MEGEAACVACLGRRKDSNSGLRQFGFLLVFKRWAGRVADHIKPSRPGKGLLT